MNLPREQIAFNIESNINSLPSATATLPAELLGSLAEGDEITLPCGECESTWKIQEVEIVFDEEGRSVANLTLAAPAEDLRRCAVSSDAVFANLSVQDVVNNLVTYAQQEIGLAIAISYVNLSTFDFTSQFNPQSKNLIEILREAAALSGNSFRFDGLTIEFGTFGASSGVVLRSGYNYPQSDKVRFFRQATYRRDASEVVGCCYVEGGTYQEAGEVTATLKLGGTNPLYTPVPPAGYTITPVVRLGQPDWRLCKAGGNNLSTRINTPGISPDVESGVIPSSAQKLDARTVMMQAAIEYLNAHAQPIETWEIDLPGTICALKTGDTARVIAACAGLAASQADYFVTAISIEGSGGKVTSRLTLSSRLDDQDHSLDRAFGKGISDKISSTPSRSGSRTVTVTIPAGAPCDGPNSSGAVVPYGYTYSDPPLIQISAAQGIATLSGATTTQVYVCVKTDPNPYPVGGVEVTLSISGVSA